MVRAIWRRNNPFTYQLRDELLQWKDLKVTYAGDAGVGIEFSHAIILSYLVRPALLNDLLHCTLKS